jgi:membrane protease YdiL (CAAX protease family)
MDRPNTAQLCKLLPLLALVPAAAVPNGTLVSLAIVIVTLWLVKDSRRPTLTLTDGRWLRTAALGIGAGLALWFLSDQAWEPLLQKWLGPINLGSFAGVRGNLPNFLVLLLLGFTFGGVIEEIIFRGFVIGWGSHLFGQRSVVPLLALSSVAFGLAHRYQGALGAVSAGVIGLCLAALYVATGKRLLAPMLAHMTIDAIGITEIYLGINR